MKDGTTHDDKEVAGAVRTGMEHDVVAVELQIGDALA